MFEEFRRGAPTRREAPVSSLPQPIVLTPEKKGIARKAILKGARKKGHKIEKE